MTRALVNRALGKKVPGEGSDASNDVEIRSHQEHSQPADTHEIHITDRAPATELSKTHEAPLREFSRATFLVASYNQGHQGQHLVNAQGTWKRRILVRAITAAVWVSPNSPIDTVADPVAANPPGLLVNNTDTWPMEFNYTGDLYFYFAPTAQAQIYIEYCELDVPQHFTSTYDEMGRVHGQSADKGY